MAAPFKIGDSISAQEADAAIQNIVPPHIRQRLRFQEARILSALHEHFPVWLEHEVNRARGLAFTSNEDEGFTHAAG